MTSGEEPGAECGRSHPDLEHLRGGPNQVDDAASDVSVHKEMLAERSVRPLAGGGAAARPLLTDSLGTGQRNTRPAVEEVERRLPRMYSPTPRRASTDQGHLPRLVGLTSERGR